MKITKPSQQPAITLTEDEIRTCYDIMSEVEQTTGILQYMLQAMEMRLKHDAEEPPGWIIAQNEMCQWMLSEIFTLFEAQYGALMQIKKRRYNLPAVAAAQK